MAKPPIYTGFDLTFRALTLDAAAQLNISSVFSNESAVNTKGFALLFDATLSTGYRETITLKSGLVYERREGTGLRIAMRMVEVKATAKLTFAAVAAQSKLGLASTTYSVEGIGLSKDVLAALIDMPLSGSFDEITFGKLRTVISEQLPTYLEGPDVGVGYYAVPLSYGPDDPTLQARAMYHAATMIAQRKSLSAAIQERPSDVNPSSIMAGYVRLAGLTDPTSEKAPSAEQAEMSTRWLNTGSLHT